MQVQRNKSLILNKIAFCIVSEQKKKSLINQPLLPSLQRLCTKLSTEDVKSCGLIFHDYFALPFLPVERLFHEKIHKSGFASYAACLQATNQLHSASIHLN